MPKYELSLSKSYVPNWAVVDGIREIFQNALDQEATMEGNHMFFDYNPSTQILTIGNKLSKLDPNTLLLGSSTKQGDDNTIGQFGEGYKVATLVLTRENKKVTFYNYGRREVWQPRFVKSRRYEAEILTFFVDKKYPWTHVPDNNLTITVEGITQAEYNEILDSNLHLQPEYNSIQSEAGEILLNSEHKGKVFVRGLYVADYLPYHYGYNFHPKHIELDRDRKLVSDFNLKWLASTMWMNSDSDAEATAKIIADLVQKGAADVEFITNVIVRKPETEQQTARLAHESFVKEHGTNAVPVTNNVEMARLSPSHKPVIVTEQLKRVIQKSDTYVKPEIIKIVPFVDKVVSWLDSASEQLSDESKASLQELIDEEKERIANGESEEFPF